MARWADVVSTVAALGRMCIYEKGAVGWMAYRKFMKVFFVLEPDAVLRRILGNLMRKGWWAAHWYRITRFLP